MATTGEDFRPTYHYTPATGWMNDPNGLFHLDGVYHMFYQYNPNDTQWGDMSWGHATSTDLVNWTEQDLALPYTDTDFVFSGSVVVDHENTSGFGYGLNGEPPVVAIYTNFHLPQADEPYDQEQALAYSLDGGSTWEFYQGNPVLDIADNEFRDPKVFWQDNPGDDDYWVMGVARAVARQAEFYKSYDLKDWSYMSSFGPANAVGGVWEVPDLIEMTVENTGETKHLLVQNINPGGIAGGSAAQYFIGDWDGVRFTADNVRPAVPAGGTVYEDFEDADYSGWTVSGTAFGDGPAAGSLPGQIGVALYEGDYLVNSFLNDDGSVGDGGTGRMVSQPFEITRDFINLKVGGGGHTWDLGLAPDEQASPTAVNLIVDGERVATVSGNFGEGLDWAGWDVSQYAGQEAQIEIVDDNTDGWGHINVDQITFADGAATPSRFLADWIDYGADHYATISWHNLPEGDGPTLISWMNNWSYSGAIPTGDFRGSMTLPRDYSLREIDGEIRLIQTPVEALEELRQEQVATEDVRVRDGVLVAPFEGQALEIVATFDAEATEASRFGVKVRVGDGEETVIGYDQATSEVFVDRSASGFIPGDTFAATHAAPLEVTPEGEVKLHIFVDAASVEVFANDGLRTITDQIFPDPGSVGVELFAEGGEASLADLDIWKLAPGDDDPEPAPKHYVGGAGDDLLAPFEGARGALSFAGRGGDDVVQGGEANDRVLGNAGADMLYGKGGNDRILGGAGDDWISSGPGRNDFAAGGAGSDVFFFGDETADGIRERTRIDDFEVGADALDLGAAAVASYRRVGASSLELTLDGDCDTIVLKGVAEYEDSLFV